MYRVVCAAGLPTYSLGVGGGTLMPPAATLSTVHSVGPVSEMPPLGFGANSSTCGQNGVGVGVLYWDGVTPIHCIPGFSGDQNGDVGVQGTLTANNNVYIGNGEVGAELYLDAIGPLTGVDATALMQLASLNCNNVGQNYQVLTRVGNTVQCTGVTDIVNAAGVNMGKTIMNSCPAGTVLTSTDGLTFICISVSADVSVPACPAGDALFGVSNGQPLCVALPVPPPANPPIADMMCPAGEVVTGFLGGEPQCGALPAPPAVTCTQDFGEEVAPGDIEMVSVTTPAGQEYSFSIQVQCPDDGICTQTYVYLCQANGAYIELQ